MSNIDALKLADYIWMDGKQIKWEEAQLHFLTHSLHYGSSVFEGIRAYNGKPFKLKEHMARLIEGAGIVDIPVEYTVEQLMDACMENIKLNDVSNGYIRPLVWRGAENWGLSGKGTKPHVAIASWSLGDFFGGDAKEKGISAKTASWLRPDPRTIPCHAKANGLYMICTLSKHEAMNAGYDEALMLDYRGHVAEISSANFFMVKDGELHTPTPDCFLNGITRQTIIGIAESKGIKVHVRTIMPEELKDADECFATGTALEIQPISKIDDSTYEVGPVTKMLLEEYQAMVRA